MTVSAAILAGGKGTRSANPEQAKLAQVIDGKSLLEWHLQTLHQSGIQHVLVIAGHLSEQVQHICSQVDTAGLELQVLTEAEQQGTVSAAVLAAEQTDNDLLIVLGDILMAFPVQDFINQWRASDRSVAVVVHPSRHPEDSDAVVRRHSGQVDVVSKSLPRQHLPNMSSAGIFAISQTGLRKYAHLKDFGSDVLPAAADSDDLFAFVSSHYFKDTGTASRLHDARDDVNSGAFARRGALQDRPALLLDRDGVLNPDDSTAASADTYHLLPGVARQIARANDRGIPVIVVTNQPAIAKGWLTFAAHESVRARMDELLALQGAFVDDYWFCPHHPDMGFTDEVPELKVQCQCRKPSPGLARGAAAAHRLDLSQSVLVGDSDRDRGLAEATGMRFVHVSPDCHELEREDCYADAQTAIARALEILGC